MHFKTSYIWLAQKYREKKLRSWRNDMNKILKEYILKNTGEKFEETPFGEIVANEINYAVNNLPEIELAREVLGEQEAQKAGVDIAQLIMGKVREALVEMLPSMVQAEVDKINTKTAEDVATAVASTDFEDTTT